MEEIKIQNRIAIECSDKETRLWKNDNGLAWQGKVSRLKNNAMLISHAKAISYGLGKGSADLVGFKKVKITQEMVGSELAVFVAIEVKTKNGRASQDQKNYINMIDSHGGISGIAKSVEDAKEILKKKG